MFLLKLNTDGEVSSTENFKSWTFGWTLITPGPAVLLFPVYWWIGNDGVRYECASVRRPPRCSSYGLGLCWALAVMSDYLNTDVESVLKVEGFFDKEIQPNKSENIHINKYLQWTFTQNTTIKHRISSFYISASVLYSHLLKQLLLIMFPECVSAFISTTRWGGMMRSSLGRMSCRKQESGDAAGEWARFKGFDTPAPDGDERCKQHKQ